MEMETFSCSITSNNEEDGHARLPGFRFHPTDEELVGFYLRRKVENRPLRIELIKHADIYKYDPWELPKFSTVGNNEWYFFCKRGRKYKNSTRPNRVTGSGFWKATGIDRPIYSSTGEEGIIGLKKTLVFYRGSAGKGNKTDWMMHEFRLPFGHRDKSTCNHMDDTTIAQEAEVWTLCRILKRNVSYRKIIRAPQDWKEMSAKRSKTNPVTDHANSKTCSLESSNQNSPSNYISFSAPIIRQNAPQDEPYSSHIDNIVASHEQFLGHFRPSSQPPSTSSTAVSSLTSPVLSCDDINELLKYTDWEDLRSVVGRSASVASASATNPSYCKKLWF